MAGKGNHDETSGYSFLFDHSDFVADDPVIGLRL
jgi:hypothetical protein